MSQFCSPLPWLPYLAQALDSWLVPLGGFEDASRAHNTLGARLSTSLTPLLTFPAQQGDERGHVLEGLGIAARAVSATEVLPSTAPPL